jgi:hypothetical protein
MSALSRNTEVLLDQFELDERFLSAPNTEALKSAVIHARDKREDLQVVLKYWQKTGSQVDNDLREIWRHEMRQVERVRAYPGADDVIVELLRYGETSDAFFVATPSDFAPLDHVARHARPDHWLNRLIAARARIVLWKNASRLAKALGAVHNQGLVFGRLDRTTVFTASASEADFRLGSFEWCVRISEIDKAPIGTFAKSRGTPIILSFVDDWRALGRLLADLLGVDRKAFVKDEVIFTVGRPRIDLDAAEIDLLRWLVEPERHREIDAEVVINRIDGVLNELGVEALEDSSRYVLAIRVDDRSALTRVLRSAANDAFDSDDADAQIKYVIADLASGVELVRTPNGSLILMTEILGYSLQPMLQGGSNASWQIANCNHARFRKDILLGRYVSAILPAHRIEVIRQGRGERRLQELRSDALVWTGAFQETNGTDDPTTIVRRGLLLSQISEALFRAAAIIPIHAKRQQGMGGGTRIIVSPRDDEVRSRLAHALRIDDPVRLLARLFEDEEADIDGKWEISESGVVGRAGRGNVAVKFERTVRRDDERVYEFKSEGELPPTADLFLRQVDEAGTEGAMRRRLRMLAALATQEELSIMLSNPRGRMQSYHEPLHEDDAFSELDGSKQSALRSIWSTGPSQLVVGPPGVGKTRLVAEIVRRVLAEHPSARILLSAQAHQALDNLAASVQKTLAKAKLDSEVLLVRSKSDSAAELSGAQTQERVRQYLKALAESPLIQKAPTELQHAVRAMRDAERTGRNNADVQWTRQRRSFESLVLQSANVLFSTTNSGDLARLVDEHTQFDWVIVEEAAKATGLELLAPLLLSMRRLLIGDHNQLPPFDTERVLRFLSDQTRVKTAVADSDALLGSIFGEFGIDELRESVEDDQLLSRTCEAAKRVILLFESLVVPELEWQEANPGRKKVAIELLDQHRMHPAIATVISECFYRDRLKNAAKREAKFLNGTPPFNVVGPLPPSPIVIIDMPYMQQEPGAAEQLPVYHNPTELKAVTRVLSMLRPLVDEEGKPPTLAVLSPYGEQVSRIRLAIEDAMTGNLAALSGFDRATKTGGFHGTVDSFQGGEADIVVISLVRNNDHTGGRALGFLRKRRRMNVLLSRAKWKLVIVTSLKFLRVHARKYSGPGQGENSDDEFLPKMLSVLDRLKCEKLGDGTPKVSVVSWHDLMRQQS